MSKAEDDKNITGLENSSLVKNVNNSNTASGSVNQNTSAASGSAPEVKVWGHKLPSVVNDTVESEVTFTGFDVAANSEISQPFTDGAAPYSSASAISAETVIIPHVAISEIQFPSAVSSKPNEEKEVVSRAKLSAPTGLPRSQPMVGRPIYGRPPPPPPLPTRSARPHEKSVVLPPQRPAYSGPPQRSAYRQPKPTRPLAPQGSLKHEEYRSGKVLLYIFPTGCFPPEKCLQDPRFFFLNDGAQLHLFDDKSG